MMGNQKDTMTIKRYRKVVLVLIGIMSAFMAIEYYNIPFPALQSEVRPWDILEYRVHSCFPVKHDGLTVKRWVRDINTWRRDKTNENDAPLNLTPEDCSKDNYNMGTGRAEIPRTVTPGTKIIEIELLFYINPMRTERVHAQTQEFTVVK